MKTQNYGGKIQQAGCLFISLLMVFLFSTNAMAANGGVVTTNSGGNNDLGYAVAIQPDGKIVVAGNSDDFGCDFDVIRCNIDGSMDDHSAVTIVTTAVTVKAVVAAVAAVASSTAFQKSYKA